MTKKEHQDICDAIDRTIKARCNDESISKEMTIASVGSLAGFKMFIDDYYASHKTD